MDYCIRKLLGLTEKNFIADENWLEIVTENNEIVHKIKGTWTNTCTSCPHCINVNLKMYKSGNLKMYNFTHSIHPSNGRIHP